MIDVLLDIIVKDCDYLVCFIDFNVWKVVEDGIVYLIWKKWRRVVKLSEFVSWCVFVNVECKGLWCGNVEISDLVDVNWV